MSWRVTWLKHPVKHARQQSLHSRSSLQSQHARQARLFTCSCGAQQQSKLQSQMPKLRQEDHLCRLRHRLYGRLKQS